MNKSARYFFIPIWMLRDIAVNRKKVIEYIFMYGIYNFSKTADLDDDDMLIKFIYASQRKEHLIPESLKSDIKNIRSDFFELDNEAFNIFGEFTAEEIKEILSEIFEEDSSLEERVIEVARVIASLDFFSMKVNVEVAIDYGNYAESFDEERYPKVMVNRDKLFEFYNNEKKERELIKYAVNLSILSLLGKKKGFMNTNKAMIFARAFGYRDHKEIAELEFKPDLYEKYTTETVSKNILNEVEEEWYVHAYRKRGMRGVYIANKTHMSREDLVMGVAIKRHKSKINKMKDEEYEKRALEALKLI